MTPNDKRPGGARKQPKDMPEGTGAREDDIVRDDVDDRGQAQGDRPRPKPGEPQKGPGSASADVGMTADGET